MDPWLDEINHVRQMLPQRLRQAMAYSNMTIYELAYRTFIHESTLRAYLAGTRVPKLPQLAALTRVLDESADWLLGIYERDTPTRDVPELTPAEQNVLAAIAAENDAGNAPTFVSIARFVQLSKQQVARIVRKLALAGWVHIDQAKRYRPGSIVCTSRYTEYYQQMLLKGFIHDEPKDDQAEDDSCSSD